VKPVTPRKPPRPYCRTTGCSRGGDINGLLVARVAGTSAPAPVVSVARTGGHRLAGGLR
jgi:hypothetical protein